MKLTDFNKVSNIIVYLSLALNFSSIIYGLSNKSYGLAVVFASLIFIFVYIFTNKTFLFVILIIFSLGVFLNYNYYSINNVKVYGKVEILKVYNYNTVCKFNGRKYYIRGDYEPLQLVFVNGEINKDRDYEKGIVGTIKVENEKIIENSFKKKIYNLRENIYEKLKENIGQRKAALASSLAFGYKDKLDEEDIDSMKNFGIVHAISVSGLHIMLIYSMIKRIGNNYISLGITLMYVIFTGADFSSLRSFLMVCILVLSKEAHKNYSALGALSLSAIVINLIAPYSVFDIGWQLSFGATLGIILYNRKLNKVFYILPKYIRENIALSLAAQVFTLPIIIYTFQEFSITFLIGNILLIPILNLIIIIGNLLILAVINMEIFDFISFVLMYLIKIYDYVIDKLEFFSQGIVYTSNEFILLYGTIFISFYFIKKGYRKFHALPIITIIFIAISIYSPFLKIKYIKYNNIMVTYKGSRIMLSNKINVDVEELKKKHMVSKVYINKEKLKLSSGDSFSSYGKNFLYKNKGNTYLIKINEGKLNSNYDIIDFMNGTITGSIIIGGSIFTF